MPCANIFSLEMFPLPVDIEAISRLLINERGSESSIYPYHFYSVNKQTMMQLKAGSVSEVIKELQYIIDKLVA
jgi:hypothetical protein